MPSSTELAVGQRCDPIARVLFSSYLPTCDMERVDSLPNATTHRFRSQVPHAASPCTTSISLPNDLFQIRKALPWDVQEPT
jgi:hypothetical protein